MSLKSDKWIAKMSLEHDMIVPFVDKQIRNGVISYGLSSTGYDIRIGTTFMYLKRGNSVFDPKNQTDFDWDTVKSESPIVMHPNDYVLGYSMEYFNLPEDTMVLVTGKSTYARSGLIVNFTPGEPGWSGQWTIELSNPTHRPIKVYPGEGIAQCVFFQSDEMPHLPYNKKRGKYMMQTGITLAKIERHGNSESV